MRTAIAVAIGHTENEVGIDTATEAATVVGIDSEIEEATGMAIGAVIDTVTDLGIVSRTRTEATATNRLPTRQSRRHNPLRRAQRPHRQMLRTMLRSMHSITDKIHMLHMEVMPRTLYHYS